MYAKFCSLESKPEILFCNVRVSILLWWNLIVWRTERINSEKDCWWWLKDRVWSWSLNSTSKLHYGILILLHQQCYFMLPLVAPISPVTRWYRTCATVLDKKHRVQTGLVLSGYRASKDVNHTLFPIQHNTVREGRITQLISNVFSRKAPELF